MIDSLFGQLTDWASKPRWSGAGFTRVVVELADLRGHPARAIARRHKASVELWLTSRLAKAGVASPRERAREVALLMEGAMMLMFGAALGFRPIDSKTSPVFSRFFTNEIG
jgi:hypothetical protein